MKEGTEDKQNNADLKIWQVAARPLGGRPRKFKSAEELLDGALAYFKFVDEHPWQVKGATQTLHDNDGSKTTGVAQNVRALTRPYTLYGLLAYLGCTYKWADLRKNYQDREGFFEVFEWIENVIRSQQLDGAMIRQFDGNIVARLQGLAETQVNKVSVTPDGVPPLTEEDIDKIREINGL